MPGQQTRKKNVRKKLNAMALEFANKNVLLVDGDRFHGALSIMLISRFRFHRQRHDLQRNNSNGKRCRREEGHCRKLRTAYQVCHSIVFPKLELTFSRYPNVYGIDMPSRKELVAYGRDEASIAKAIGADFVIFQTLPDLVESVRRLNTNITTFDCSVFTGDYVTGGVDENYLEEIESLRSEKNCFKSDTNGLQSMSMLPTDNKTSICGSDDTVGLHNSWKYS